MPLLITTALTTALGGILCFVPLFNLLGYEFSWALGLMASATSIALGLWAARKGVGGGQSLVLGLAAALGHLLPPLLLITLNALRVRNCDYWEGLAFYGALAGCTAMYGASVGVLIGIVLPGQRGTAEPGSRGVRVLAAVLAWLTPALWCLWDLYWQPPIFVFDHLWGYFAGSLYDESIAVDDRLLVFRAGTLMRVGIVALILSLWTRRRWLATRERVLWGGALLAAVVLFETVAGPRFGFRVSRTDIEAELSTVVDRPGVRVFMPDTIKPKDRDALADDHAFRVAQISKRLGAQREEPIRSYVYRNASHKSRWMGGHRTMIAKPWLGEIHIHDTRSPHPILAHEMVHALAAPYGSAPFGVSAKGGLMVNLGLVEGLAEALTTQRGPLDLHTATRAMQDLGHLPNIRSIVNPAGFWSQSPRRAYTVAGSFVRYLIDTRGPQRALDLYADGDFQRAYGTSLDDLATEWEQFITTLEILPRDVRKAREHFRRGSIFRRPCAHEIAQLRAEAQEASPQDAVNVYREIAMHLGNAPSARLDIAHAMLDADDVKGFMELSNRLFEEDTLNSVQSMGLREEQGRILWKTGDFTGARQAFEEVLKMQPSIAAERMQWVQLWALDLPEPYRERVRAFLAREVRPLAAVVDLEILSAVRPEDPTPPYLTARQLHGAEAWEQCIEHLDRVGPHPFPLIEAERLRLRAASLFELGKYEESIAAYTEYNESAPTSGDRARGRDWIERARWRLTTD